MWGYNRNPTKHGQADVINPSAHSLFSLSTVFFRKKKKIFR